MKTLLAVIAVIRTLTAKYFEKFAMILKWEKAGKELRDRYSNVSEVTGNVATKMLITLFVCVAIICVDFGTILPFYEGLSDKAGVIIGTIILGIAPFILFGLELYCGEWFEKSRKNGDIFYVILSLIAGLAISLLPAFLIYRTLQLSSYDEEEIGGAYLKAQGYMIFSIIVHMLVFFNTRKITDSFDWLLFKTKWKIYNWRSPLITMKHLRKDLITEFETFDRNMNRLDTIDEKIKATETMNNRAWYLRQKLSDGDVMNDFDLSDYNESIDYSPFAFVKTTAGQKNAEVDNGNGKYQYSRNGKYNYTVS